MPEYLGFSAEATEEAVRRAFGDRFGRPPAEVIRRNVVLVGPVDGECWLCGGTGPLGENCQTAGCKGGYLRK